MSSFPITVLSSKKFKNQNEYNNLLNAIAYQFVIDNSKSRDKYEGLMYLYSRLYFDVDDELKRNRFWSILSEEELPFYINLAGGIVPFVQIPAKFGTEVPIACERFLVTLLSVADVKNGILHDRTAIYLACDLLYRICSIYKTRQTKDVILLNKQAGHNILLKEQVVSDMAEALTKKELPHMPSLTKMFLYNGMKKCIDFFTYIVLCRFPSHHIKEHVEQFLYEELESIKIPTPKTHPIIHALNKTQRKLHRKFKNHESMYAIDTPSGPQWTLRRIAHIFGYTSYDLLMYVHYSIVQGILEKYLEVQDKDEICIHDLYIQNSAVQEMLNLYCNNGLLRNQIVIDLYQGNCYKDTYQAMADELTIRNQQMDLGRKNSVIEKLEEDNALLSIENEEHKNEIGTLKETNELLENIFNECDESIAASEDKIRELKKEKANLENRLNLINYELSKLKGRTQDVDSLAIARFLADEQKTILRPVTCLRLIELLSAERLLILPEAYLSAEQVNDKFQNGHRLLTLLCRMVTYYYDSLISYGNSIARGVFTPDQYVQHESETLKASKSAEFWSDRTVNYNGRRVRMTNHLRIGVTNDVSQTLRVYFFFDNENNKLVIGYCGQHPKNTKS